MNTHQVLDHGLPHSGSIFLHLLQTPGFFDGTTDDEVKSIVATLPSRNSLELRFLTKFPLCTYGTYAGRSTELRKKFINSFTPKEFNGEVKDPSSNSLRDHWDSNT